MNARRVDPSALAFSLSSHRHSHISLVFSFHFMINNKQLNKLHILSVSLVFRYNKQTSGNITVYVHNTLSRTSSVLTPSPYPHSSLSLALRSFRFWSSSTPTGLVPDFARPYGDSVSDYSLTVTEYHTHTHPPHTHVTFFTLTCPQVLWFFSQLNPHRSRVCFCATI